MGRFLFGLNKALLTTENDKFSQARGDGMKNKELLERIDRLESQNVMNDLVSDYCHGFDKHDWDTFIAIWHEDAVWDIGAPFGVFEGHEGIRRAVWEVLYPAWRESHHWVSNVRITFDGPDQARGVCDVDCMGANHDNVVQMVGATYIDKFERRNNVWKIVHRKVDMHYFNSMPGLEMSRPG